MNIKIFSNQNEHRLKSEINNFLSNNKIKYVDMKINVAQPETYDKPIITIVILYDLK